MEKTELIFKVLSNETTEKERIELNDWISLNETNRRDYEDLKLLSEGLRISNDVVRDDAYHDGLHKIKSLIRIKERKNKRIVITTVILITISILAITYFLITPNFQRKNNSTLMKFNHTSISNVIAVLKKEYRIEVVAPTSILNCEFTGSFYNDSANDVIKSIAESMNFEYSVINERSFKLNGNGCTIENKN